VSFDRSSRGPGGGAPGRGPAATAGRSALGPGKQTLTSQLDQAIVQQRAAHAPEADVHAAAAHGTRGSATALPHRAQIQQAFGRHDIGHIQAHVGGAAADGAAAMGATAFAVGDRVAFSGAPDLHTAAHEAAHVVQQRAGVQLRGGVGEVGDRHEQHADAVADLVVQGQSAEPLLDQYAGQTGGGGSGAVQRHAFINGTQVLRTDPAVTGDMVDFVTDLAIRDYLSMDEFKNHVAGKTDYLGTLRGDGNTWLRFSPTGLNVLGEQHATASAMEFVLPAVGSKNFISESISTQDPAAGSDLKSSYDAEHVDRFKEFGIDKEKDKTKFGAEPLLPKFGWGLTALLPYLNLDTGTADTDKNVHKLTKGNYAGQIMQSLVKESWAWAKDTMVTVALMQSQFAPVPPKAAALADVVRSLHGVLDKFITGLPLHGWLGDPLILAANAPMFLPLIKFAQAAIDALVEQAIADPGSRMTAKQKTKFAGPATNDEKRDMFADWRNFEIEATVKKAAARGVRYAGMGWAHMDYLRKSPPANTQIFDMDDGTQIEDFRTHTTDLENIAVKQR
jgi:hypothetical protein